MDSAPKDGTEILCWEDGQIFTAQWFLGEWWGDGICCIAPGSPVPRCRPAYWMPCPADPE